MLLIKKRHPAKQSRKEAEIPGLSKEEEINKKINEKMTAANHFSFHRIGHKKNYKKKDEFVPATRREINVRMTFAG